MTHAPPANVTDLGYLIGGARAAVRTGLAMLHARGLVVAERSGGLRRTGTLPVGVEPLERAIFGALDRTMAPREVANQHQVRRALAGQREELIGLGLLRPFWRRLTVPATMVVTLPLLAGRMVAVDLLSRGNAVLAVLALALVANLFLSRQTVTGARLVRDARRRYPSPAGPQVEPGMAVALYGVPALRILMPRFARDSGLIDTGCWARLLAVVRPGAPSIPAGAV